MRKKLPIIIEYNHHSFISVVAAAAAVVVLAAVVAAAAAVVVAGLSNIPADLNRLENVKPSMFGRTGSLRTRQGLVPIDGSSPAGRLSVAMQVRQRDHVL